MKNGIFVVMFFVWFSLFLSIEGLCISQGQSFAGDPVQNDPHGIQTRKKLLNYSMQGSTTENGQAISIKNQKINIPLSGEGHSQTWDGRVFISKVIFEETAETLTVGWRIQVLRPEYINTDKDGIPRFLPQSFSPGERFYQQPEVLEEESFTVQQRDNIFKDDATKKLGLTMVNAVHIAPDPRYTVNPYPSNAEGDEVSNGGFDTYKTLIYTQMYEADPFNPSNKAIMGVLPVTIVVGDAKTAEAEIYQWIIDEPFKPLITEDNKYLYGIEPSLSFDGRLLVFQGHPHIEGDIDVIVYSWNPTPGAISGWSKVKGLQQMFYEDRDKIVDGIVLHERFPIAKEVLRAPNGEVYGLDDLYFGAYPWISHDASELIHMSTAVGSEGDGALRAGFSIIGRLTHFIKNHVEGPLNPDRGYTFPNEEGEEGRVFFSSTGLAPGFWSPYPQNTNIPLANEEWGPVYPIFGSNTRDYGEISFTDKDSLFFLHMNESINLQGVIDPLITPDTSANSNTGELIDAYFPYEYVFDGKDVQRGIIGQAIYFTAESAVLIEPSNSINQINQAFTLEAFIKPLKAFVENGDGQAIHLLTKPETLAVLLGVDGSIEINMVFGQQLLVWNVHSSKIKLQQWNHFAMTYDRKNQQLFVYVNGVKIATKATPVAELYVNNSEFIIGPASFTEHSETQKAILLMDEVGLSGIVRSDREIARNALVLNKTSVYVQESIYLQEPIAVTVPLGLNASEIKIPKDNWPSAEKVSLGKAIFLDEKISSNDLSCASCHDPDLSFSDGEDTSSGNNGIKLKRTSPVVFNRAFSTLQFWDGRAQSLDQQVIMPITSADEMAADMDDVLNYLNGNNDYRDGFDLAFGESATEENLAMALASYLRSVMIGNSRVDQFENGKPVLNAAEQRGRDLFRGKGRCTACHSGANYTDESFHHTAALDDNDNGRGNFTGLITDSRKFKTPTLRNIAVTEPYLHDGSVETLEAVIDLYDQGGLHETNRAIEIRPLGLTDSEKADLLAFLLALTGEVKELVFPILE